MYDILARASLIFTLIAYCALLIPLIVWAISERLGVAIMTGFASALVRVLEGVRVVI